MKTPEQYLRPEVIQQVARLDLRAKFIVEGFLQGLHASPFQGFSVEFSEHRKYTPGDELAVGSSVFGFGPSRAVLALWSSPSRIARAVTHNSFDQSGRTTCQEAKSTPMALTTREIFQTSRRNK